MVGWKVAQMVVLNGIYKHNNMITLITITTIANRPDGLTLG